MISITLFEFEFRFCSMGSIFNLTGLLPIAYLNKFVLRTSLENLKIDWSETLNADLCTIENAHCCSI